MGGGGGGEGGGLASCSRCGSELQITNYRYKIKCLELTFLARTRLVMSISSSYPKCGILSASLMDLAITFTMPFSGSTRSFPSEQINSSFNIFSLNQDCGSASGSESVSALIKTAGSESKKTNINLQPWSEHDKKEKRAEKRDRLFYT